MSYDAPSSGDTVDAIHSADFVYTFAADTAAGSQLVFSVRRDPADELAAVEILSGSGLAVLNGATAANSGDATLERLSATQCRATILARALVELDPGPYAVEVRELTTDGKTKSKHELALNLRRSASRRRVA